MSVGQTALPGEDRQCRPAPLRGIKLGASNKLHLYAEGAPEARDGERPAERNLPLGVNEGFGLREAALSAAFVFLCYSAGTVLGFLF
jgi:hypothetical protein